MPEYPNNVVSIGHVASSPRPQPPMARVPELASSLDREQLGALLGEVVVLYNAGQLEVPCIACEVGVMYCKPKRGTPTRPFCQCRECRSQLHLNSTTAEHWLLHRAADYILALKEGIAPKVYT